MSSTTRSPYPNVRMSVNGSYYAYLPVRTSSRYLGTYPTAELAYAAVLREQAAGHEEKAAAYRAKASELAS